MITAEVGFAERGMVIGELFIEKEVGMLIGLEEI
jgi:hypothetical protein